MSYLFFEDILEVLGKKLRYDAVVNYAGNSFCEKSWDMIEDSFPLNNKKNENTGEMAIAKFLNNTTVMVKGEKTFDQMWKEGSLDE